MHEIGRPEITTRAAPAVRGLLPKTFESFREPNYRLYWLSSMGQIAAMQMEMMARTWYIYRLEHSKILLGAAALSVAAPVLALSLFGGVLADRISRKYVLLFTLAAAAAVTLAIGLIIDLGSITWVHLIIAGTAVGTIQAIHMPARQAMVPAIVGPQRLTNAVSLNIAGMNITSLLAPALGGLLIAQLGMAGVYYVTTGLYLVALLVLLPLPRADGATAQGRSAVWEILDAFRYLRQNTTVLTILLLTMVVGMLSWPLRSLLPIFTEDVLEVGPEGLGMLLSMSGLGSLMGSAVLASLGDRRRGIRLLHSTLLLSMALAGFAFSRWYTPSLLLMALVGFGTVGRMALTNALVIGYTQDAYRGRVMSVYMMEWGLSSFVTFGVAVLAEYVDVQWAIGGMALLLLPLTAYAYAFLPRLRKLD